MVERLLVAASDVQENDLIVQVGRVESVEVRPGKVLITAHMCRAEPYELAPDQDVWVDREVTLL